MTTNKTIFQILAVGVMTILSIWAYSAWSSEEVPIRDKTGKVVHVFVCKGPFFCEDNRSQVTIEKLPDGGYY